MEKETFRNDELREIKAKVKAQEKENFGYIILFKSKGTWWKMGGSSALFFCNFVNRDEGENKSPRTDRDSFSKFHEGVVSAPDEGYVERKLGKYGVKKLKRQEKGIRYFKLPKKYTVDEVKLLRSAKGYRDAMMREALFPKAQFPVLQKNLEEIMKIAYNQVRKDDKVNREFLTMTVLERARATLGMLVRLEQGGVSEEKVFRKINENIVAQKRDLFIIYELEIWGAETCGKLGERMVEAGNLVKSVLKEYDGQREVTAKVKGG